MIDTLHFFRNFSDLFVTFLYITVFKCIIIKMKSVLESLDLFSDKKFYFQVL
jgi:hypothetical protein